MLISGVAKFAFTVIPLNLGERANWWKPAQ